MDTALCDYHDRTLDNCCPSNRPYKNGQRLDENCDDGDQETEDEVVRFSTDPNGTSALSEATWQRDVQTAIHYGISIESTSQEGYGGPPEAYVFMNRDCLLSSGIELNCGLDTTVALIDDSPSSPLRLRLPLPFNFDPTSSYHDGRTCLSPVKLNRFDQDPAPTLSTTATTVTTLSTPWDSTTHSSRSGAISTNRKRSLWKWGPVMLHQMTPRHFFRSSRSSSSILQGDGLLSPSPAVYNTPLSLPRSPLSIQSPEKQTNTCKLLFDARRSAEWTSKHAELHSPRRLLNQYSTEHHLAYPDGYESPSATPFYIHDGTTAHEYPNSETIDEPMVTLPFIKRSPTPTRTTLAPHQYFNPYSHHLSTCVSDDRSEGDHSDMCAEIPTQESLSSTNHYHNNNAHLHSFQAFLFSSRRTTQPIQMDDDDVDENGSTHVIDYDQTPRLRSEFTEDSSSISHFEINPYSYSPPSAKKRVDQNKCKAVALDITIPSNSLNRSVDNGSSTQTSNTRNSIHPGSNTLGDSPQPEPLYLPSSATTSSTIASLTDIPISPVPKLSLHKKIAPPTADGMKSPENVGSVTERSPNDLLKSFSSRRIWRRFFGLSQSQSGTLKDSVDSRKEGGHSHTRCQSMLETRIEKSEREQEGVLMSKQGDHPCGSCEPRRTNEETPSRQLFEDLALDLGVTDIPYWEAGVAIRLAMRQKNLAAIGHGRIKLEQIRMGKDFQPALILEDRLAKSRRALILDSDREASTCIKSLAFLEEANFKNGSEDVVGSLMANKIPFLAVPVRNTENKCLIFLFDNEEQRNRFIKIITLLQTYSHDLQGFNNEGKE